MSMKDFPPMPFPEGVNCKQQTGFSIDFIEPPIEEGLCQVCHGTMSNVLFHIGSIHHHLCANCFEKMMRLFSMKWNGVECTKMVSGDFRLG